VTDWSISRCRAADLEAVVELVNAAFRGEGGQAGWTSELGMVAGPRITRATLSEELLATEAISILLLRDTSRLLACIRLELKPDPAGAPVCHIGMLAVRPDEQNRGWGRLLLQQAEATGRGAGAGVATMTVVSVRESLIGWYERQGYQRTGVAPFPYDDTRFGSALRADLQFIVLEKRLLTARGN
jgi:ribosomal protein S18 acetylase RimI-like enzyme